MALELQTYGIKVDYIYTFGSPRVGNVAFANYFNSFFENSYRLVHYRDIIPHFVTDAFGFYHAGTEIFYT